MTLAEQKMSQKEIEQYLHGLSDTVIKMVERGEKDRVCKFMTGNLLDLLKAEKHPLNYMRLLTEARKEWEEEYANAKI